MSQSAESGAAFVPECYATDPWNASLPKRKSVGVVAARAPLLVVTDAVKSGDEVKFLMSKNYSWKICYLQILLTNIYQL